MISTRPPAFRPFLVVLAALWAAPAVSTLEHLDAGQALLDLVVTIRFGAWAGVGGETRSRFDAVGAVYDAG